MSIFCKDTHEVILTSGDILFYESSKCFHGRPRPFNGTWYSSVFVHYYPTKGYKENYNANDRLFAIPPQHWKENPTTHYEIPLQMHGTTMEEPWCPNNWCNTLTSKKWSGPGEEGYVVDPDGTKRVMDASRIACLDKNDECEAWASWNSNECVKNSGFMSKNCRKSCGLCGPQGRDEL
jgi:ShK domain-like